VETSKPAALFSGNPCTNVGDGVACDILYEQMIPESALAAEYVACPTLTHPIGCSGSGCANDLFQIMATEDSTTVEFIPSVTATIVLNKGGFLEYYTNVPHVVRASKPIYTNQMLTGQDSGPIPPGTGDPALFVVPPVDQFQFSYIFLTPNSSVVMSKICIAFSLSNLSSSAHFPFLLYSVIAANKACFSSMSIFSPQQPQCHDFWDGSTPQSHTITMDAHGMGTSSPTRHESHRPYCHGAATTLSTSEFDFD
jgi:hypothetical protein